MAKLEEMFHHLALSGAIKEEIIRGKLAYYGLRFILNIILIFKVHDIEITKEDFWATSRKGGLKLLSEAYTIFLRDLKEGKLGAVVFDRDNWKAINKKGF